MSYNFVTEWVIHMVRESYADDIALVVSHTTLRMDEKEKAISYFVPVTKRGEGFAQTFILSGIGYDIWGISWERLEGFAKLWEYNITCLADGEVLYARTAEDRERFEGLKRELASRLADRDTMRVCALQAYKQAKDIYLDMLFASESDVKMGAGYVLDYLAQAVAFSNHTYFRRSQTDQVRELREMKRVPQGFEQLYSEIIVEKNVEIQKKKCYLLIGMIREYLAEEGFNKENSQPCERNFQDLADWYAELSYTWLRIRYYAGENDRVRAYMWGIYLQKELNQVCGDFGMEKIELMKYYDADDLLGFAAYADKAEGLIRTAIEKGGGRIREFADEREFLNEI